MTRDHSRYPRVYAELVQYGTARNLYGAKPTGIAVTAAVLTIVAVLAVLRRCDVVAVSWWSLSFAGLSALALLALWLFQITPDYVRPASDRYTDALLATANEPNAHP